MSHTYIPYFHNSLGVERISTGAYALKCIGALPPFDHPHIFLEIPSSKQVTCPYCSTIFVFNPQLKETESEPSEALFGRKSTN